MRKLTTKQFILQAQHIHGNRYDYSNAEYVNSRTTIAILCKVHGQFLQKADSHLRGIGCKKCGDKLRADKNTKWTKKRFITTAVDIHNNKYVYSSIEYTDMYTNIDIICPTHGVFSPTPFAHVLAKTGCPTCGRSTAAKKTLNTKVEFLTKCRAKFQDRYTYTDVDYNGHATPVLIGCKVHGNFTVKPSRFLSAVDPCPLCTTKRGFDYAKPAILYYLSINNGQAYKIGVTNRSVDRRFSLDDLKKVRVIETWDYMLGQDCYSKEQEILKEYSEFKYKGDPLLESGNTELFNKDVLQLNKDN